MTQSAAPTNVGLETLACRVMLECRHPGAGVVQRRGGTISDEQPSPDEVRTAARRPEVYGGRYAVEQELGRGGMGRVLRARDLRIGRAVALKLLQPGAQRERFEQEARAAGALNHPNILAVHDVGEEGGEPFIVSELLQGKTLRAVLRERPLPAERVLDFALQLSEGMAAAHRAGIVHRDLKPENLFITDEGRLKILDVGIAKLEGPDAFRTETGALLGTPAYMSPEQMRGNPADARSDIFACGCVLHEMLSGARPFAGETPMEMGYSILHDEPAPLPDGVSPALREIVSRCLRKDPGDRLQSASELLEALTPARSPAATRRRGNPRLAAAGVAFALLCVALAWKLSPSLHSSGRRTGSERFRLANLPASRTEVPAAEASYRRGLQRLSQGEFSAANQEFDAAIAADSNFASAHLQRLVSATYWCPTLQSIARPDFAAANRLRDSLTPRDQELLHALEPAVLDPPDLRDGAARVRALAERRPGDAQIWDILGIAENKLFHFRASAGAFAHAAAVDPDDSLPGIVAWEQDVPHEEGDRLLDDCLAKSSTAEWCRVQRVNNRLQSGACAEAEQDARTLLALNPESYGPWMLANALAGQNASREAIALALGRAHERLPEKDRATAAANDQIYLSFWTGDFEAGIRRTEAWATSRPVTAATLQVEALWEIGQRRAAAQAALSDLKRADALPRFERPETDPLPRMLARAHAGGLLSDSEFVSRRDRWIEDWRRRLDDDGWTAAAAVIWQQAFAYASTHDEAVAALNRLPPPGALPPMNDRRFFTHDGPSGELLLLAGRPADAIPRLASEANRCSFQMERVQAMLGWGLALEATGDLVSACAKYAWVTRQWGAARPKSVTAEKAAERWKALDCAGRK